MTDTEAAHEDGRWQVEVDRSVCIGSGMCAGIAPEHFRLTGRRSRPVNEQIAPDEDVIEAGESCPVEAILVRDARTGEVLVPIQDHA